MLWILAVNSVTVTVKCCDCAVNSCCEFCGCDCEMLWLCCEFLLWIMWLWLWIAVTMIRILAVIWSEGVVVGVLQRAAWHWRAGCVLPRVPHGGAHANCQCAGMPTVTETSPSPLVSYLHNKLKHNKLFITSSNVGVTFQSSNITSFS
jgi:hypothetical protein